MCVTTYVTIVKPSPRKLPRPVALSRSTYPLKSKMERDCHIEHQLLRIFNQELH